MCRTFRFFIENAKNIGFLISVLAAILAFLFTLHGLPVRIEKAESNISDLRSRHDRIELRLGVIEGAYSDMKLDLREIKNDIKTLLQKK